MKLAIDKIHIGERQRIDLGDIEDLATSLREIGQINDITVEQHLDGTWHLVTGMRRLTAAKSLGWTEISAKDHGSLTPALKQRIEYEEDVKRKDRDGAEKCIALYKLQKALRSESDKAWNVREMAAFTQLSKSSVAHMLQIAEYLVNHTEDTEVWDAAKRHWVEAYKMLMDRQLKLAQAELERRRQIRAREQQPELPTAPVASADCSVQNLDTTSSEQPATKTAEHEIVYINGHNMSFAKAVCGEHFLDNQYYAVLAIDPGLDLLENLVLCLRDEGLAVIWGDLVNSNHVQHMPYPVYWNKVLSEQTSPWPFQQVVQRGIVFGKRIPDKEFDYQTNCIAAAADEDGSMPVSVVDFSLSFCPPNVAVICPSNAPVVQVAMTGRVPIFFEPDKAKFDAMCEALKAYYESQIPGVEVRMR